MVRRLGILGLIFVVLYLGTGFFYARLEKRLAIRPQKPASEKNVAVTQVQQKEPPQANGKDGYEIIITRNIFQASEESKEEATGKKEEKQSEELVPTTLKLTLLGTAAGTEESARAIIVDETTKKQDIYQVGDAVQKAIIKRIERGRVVLRLQGRDEVLQIKDREGQPELHRPKPGPAMPR